MPNYIDPNIVSGVSGRTSHIRTAWYGSPAPLAPGGGAGEARGPPVGAQWLGALVPPPPHVTQKINCASPSMTRYLTILSQTMRFW